VVRANMSWMTADRKDFRSPQGADYFGSNGREIGVLGAMFTGPDAIAALVPAFDKCFVKAIVVGAKGLRSFPAGPHGGALYCTHASSGGPLIGCVWADKTGTGEVRYWKMVSSLGDAASKPTRSGPSSNPEPTSAAGTRIQRRAGCVRHPGLPVSP
jgi:hypothetical protein